MIRLINLRGILVPLVCALLVGCGDAPANRVRTTTSLHQTANPKMVIAKLQALCDEGQRLYPQDSHTHAEVSGWYIAELDKIELRGCPADFVERFQSYKQAWDAVWQRSQQPPKDKSGIKSYWVLFSQLKDELLPKQFVHGRGDDALLNTLLVRARELGQAASTK